MHRFSYRLFASLSLGLALTSGTAFAEGTEPVIARAIDTPGFGPDAHSTDAIAVEVNHVYFFDYLNTRTPDGRQWMPDATSAG